jgi:serine protease Do
MILTSHVYTPSLVESFWIPRKNLAGKLCVMRKFLYPSLLFIAMFCVSFGPEGVQAQAVQAQVKASAPGNAPATFADLVEDLLPSVVNISSTQKYNETEDYPELPQFPPGSPFEDFFEEFMGRRQDIPAIPPASLGSGFIVDAENGYIVTNNHVVKDADEVRVTFHDDETIEAEVIGRDEKTDLAILKVETDKELKAAKFGDSDYLRVGDWIVAIGNPFGLGGTVTAGIISARQRDINAGPYDDFLQTDASINRGNSGGPMFDLKGKVIGINTAIFSPSGGSVGIGFAIPSDLAEPVIKQLIEYGRTRRGWLGVRIQSVTEEIADSLGLEKPRGALVASVTPEGPAEKAGMKTGDIILEFAGQEVEEMRELPRIVAETPINETVRVVLWSEGDKKTVEVKIGELEKAEEEGLIASSSSETDKTSEVKIDSVGLGIVALDAENREEFRIPSDVQGVMVNSVENLSEAAKKGLRPGDVIVEINQQQIESVDKVKEYFAKAREAGRKSVLLLVNREGDVRFVALRLDEEK